MKIAVLGAGAVGSYYGGRLAESGNEVILIGRHTHIAAIKESGLTIKSRISGESKSYPEVSERLETSFNPDLILVTVKSFDTAAAVRCINKLDTPPKAVLTLQNGVENHLISAKILNGIDVYPTVVYVAVESTRPGVVNHYARGEIVLPEKLRKLVSLFQSAGLQASTTNDIVGMLWKKLMHNASLNALSMITDTSFSRLSSSLHGSLIMQSAAEEVVRVSESLGISIGVSDPGVAVLEAAQSLGDGMSSMWQDLRAGKKLEIEALNGVIVREGQKNSIPIPVNETLYAVASLIDRQRSKL